MTAIEYELSASRQSLPALVDADASRFHLGCSGALVAPNGPSEQHLCVACQAIGYLGPEVGPRDPTKPTALERMLGRWQTDSGSSLGLPVPTDPREWHWFLGAYFHDGLWLMSANDDRQFTVPDDSYLFLCDTVVVSRADRKSADLALPEPERGPTRCLMNTQVIKELTPGLLVVGNDTGQFARLDGHMTTSDREIVHRSRCTPYLGQPVPCEDSHCPYCTDPHQEVEAH